MTAQPIDGKALAASLRAKLARDVEALRTQYARPPKLVVVLVGHDAPSEVYVRNKTKACADVGIDSDVVTLPTSTTQAQLTAQIQKFNDDTAVHGILVQFPLPKALSAHLVMSTIAPAKDVDGLHPLNQGRLFAGLAGFVPCTPQGCVLLAKTVRQDLAGAHSVVIGRSLLVGRPMAHLLLQENCTVSLAHSQTKYLPQLTAQADILVAAAGQANMVKGDWIKAGAIVIDVGIHRTADGLTGDVDFSSAAERALAITPVPGGVGPMTVACLLKNTVQAARQQMAAS